MKAVVKVFNSSVNKVGDKIDTNITELNEIQTYWIKNFKETQKIKERSKKHV